MRIQVMGNPLLAALQGGDWAGARALFDCGHTLPLALPLPRFPWDCLFPSGELSADDLECLRRNGLLHQTVKSGEHHLLHHVAKRGHLPTLHALLDEGLDTNHVGNFGLFPLVEALYGSDGQVQWRAAQVLLHRGADPNVDGLGSTPRPFFVFLNAVSEIFEEGGWSTVSTLWDAFDQAGVDYQLTYQADNKTPLNYHLLDCMDSRFAVQSQALWLNVMCRLDERGISFSPRFKAGPYFASLKATAQENAGQGLRMLQVFQRYKKAMKQGRQLEVQTQATASSPRPRL